MSTAEPTEQEVESIMERLNHHGRIVPNPNLFHDPIMHAIALHRMEATLNQINEPEPEPEPTLLDLARKAARS